MKAYGYFESSKQCFMLRTLSGFFARAFNAQNLPQHYSNELEYRKVGPDQSPPISAAYLHCLLGDFVA